MTPMLRITNICLTENVYLFMVEKKQRSILRWQTVRKLDVL